MKLPNCSVFFSLRNLPCIEKRKDANKFMKDKFYEKEIYEITTRIHLIHIILYSTVYKIFIVFCKRNVNLIHYNVKVVIYMLYANHSE